MSKRLLSGDLGEVVRGGSIAFVYRVATMAVSYGLLFLIAHTLGEEGFGVYNLSLSLLGILIMIGCMGFNTSVVRFTSQYNAKGWQYSVQSLYRAVMRLVLPLSLVVGAGVMLSARYLAEEVYDDPALYRPFLVVGLILPFAVVATVNVEYIRGLKEVHVSEFFRNLAIQLVTLVALFVASFFHLDTSYPVIFYGVGFVLAMSATTVFIVNHLRKQSKVREQGEPVFVLRSHLWISLPMILTSFIQLINGKVDTLMIGLYEPTATIGVFGAALKLSVITNLAISALKTIAMPKISEMFWQNKMAELNGLIRHTTKLIFLFSAPVCVLLMIFPEPLLGFFGEGFERGADTLRIFAVTQLFNSASGLVAVFLNMTGNQAYFTRLVAVATALNIGLNILLIPAYGMEGAAVASLVSVAVWNVAGAVFIYRKYRITTFFSPFSSSK